jgi:serine/threonine-protein kinase
MSTEVVTTFLSQLRSTQVLEPAQLDEVERLARAATQVREVAGELVRRSWLTPYQANQLARGKGAELVLGPYIMLEPLARGGMGEVFKARHRHLQRLVALKLIRPEQRDSQDLLERFRREFRLLADLRHPHIVQAHDAGPSGEVWFLAMELLEGVNLDQLVRKGGPLPVAQACHYVRQAALGLQHAHERGLVHRDIKPSNLFLTAEGIKVLDLGLARPAAFSGGGEPRDLTRANMVMGTPDYLAPEQALDPRRADARSDLYSLGCTLYFLLTSRPPFPEEGTLTQKLLYHQQMAPPPVESVRPDVPPAVAELLRRLLAKSPEQRPAGAAQVVAALAPFAAAPANGPSLAQPGGGGSAPPTESLVNARAAGPERGFTLTADPAPTTDFVPSHQQAASLTGAPASAPARGFTLVTESLPPTAAPSLVDSRAAGSERGFTLVAESLPPTGAPPGAVSEHGPTQPITLIAAAVAEPRRPRRILLAVVGAAAALLLVALGVVLALSLMRPNSGRAPGDTEVAQGQKPGKTDTGTKKTDTRPTPQSKEKDGPADPAIKEKPPEPDPPGDGKPPPKVELPTFLGPLGPNEEPEAAPKPFPLDPYLSYLAAAPGNPGVVKKGHLNDMQDFAFKAGDFWWEFGKDGHLGDKGNFNKTMIQVKDVASGKGLGMYPPPKGYTRVCYVLGKAAKSLHGAVAISEFNGGPPPAPTRFAVLGDGKVLWRSKVIATRGVPEKFTINVRQVDVLELRVYTEDGSNRGAHAAWLNPYVVFDETSALAKGGRVKGRPVPLEPKGPKEMDRVYLMPTIAPDAKLVGRKAGVKVFLSNLKEFSVKGDWGNPGAFAKNGHVGDPQNSFVRVNGKTYPKALGMPAPHVQFLRVCFALGKQGKTLHGSVALDDGKNPPWSIKNTTFVVIGDGMVLWRSQPIGEQGIIEPFTVDVRGVAVLELRVYTDYAGANASRAVWLDPYVTVADG